MQEVTKMRTLRSWRISKNHNNPLRYLISYVVFLNVLKKKRKNNNDNIRYVAPWMVFLTVTQIRSDWWHLLYMISSSIRNLRVRFAIDTFSIVSRRTIFGHHRGGRVFPSPSRSWSYVQLTLNTHALCIKPSNNRYEIRKTQITNPVEILTTNVKTHFSHLQSVSLTRFSCSRNRLLCTLLWSDCFWFSQITWTILQHNAHPMSWPTTPFGSPQRSASHI